ncbi:putative acylesterase/phospholipase RssA [Rhodoblastus acidophilus]|uniref:patatin-like phospholipase family protein n=1 Tax=Rhodoblastus acidophilus TaxID=1074 RepID=UPI002224EEA5|nr:patatin-like phospholipase family protein [Rhodoblastus acidophilus]MCW2282377.1 putative acylesterase/phospholipase RssA [Rhodoblastus acidophilus]MCW2331218.1 putative acylesterase/phospholipase RssA [Rhodoblastus acidophilus]
MNRDLKGVALAGGGPVGGIYEVGALAALDEALIGLDLTGCDIFVGVSSGAFVAAGLANGVTPRDMHRLFIESEEADDPFEPEILLQPAFQEFGQRLASLPGLLAVAMQSYLNGAPPHGFAESLQQLGRALPAGLFDNEPVGAYLARLFSAGGRVNDFRRLAKKLFIVATDLDSCSATPFGGPGLDDVPISRAVQASSALPGLFPPVEINGRHYVDGALMKTLHASVALAEGAKLLICVNPLTPIDADAVARKSHRRRLSLAARGLPSVMSQTFRALIHSRMRVGMERYAQTFPDADVILFEPARDDAEMFFTNVFSYSSRHRLAEHAYQRTREELRRRADELDRVLARHCVSLDRACLADETRTLSRRRRAPRRVGLKQTASQLGTALDSLERALR